MRDLTGYKIGRLTVLYATEKRSQSSIIWKVQCRCGKMAEIASRDLLHGVSTRRGCGNCRDTSHPLYSTWIGMIRRCTCTDDPNYKNYGGRGITVCLKWREEFLNFIEDMGKRPANTTLDRIDNDGNYCKENCRWADHVTQVTNTRSNTKKISGQELIDIYLSTESNKSLAERYNVSIKTIANIKCMQYRQGFMKKLLEERFKTLPP